MLWKIYSGRSETGGRAAPVAAQKTYGEASDNIPARYLLLVIVYKEPNKSRRN